MHFRNIEKQKIFKTISALLCKIQKQLKIFLPLGKKSSKTQKNEKLVSAKVGFKTGENKKMRSLYLF